VAGAEALNEDWGLILKATILMGIVVFWILQVCFTRYRLGRHEVEVILFGCVIRKVMLGNIDDVLLGARFPGEFWVTPGFFQGRFMTIRRKRGLFRYLTITPPNPREFRANLFYALGWNPKGLSSDGN